MSNDARTTAQLRWARASFALAGLAAVAAGVAFVVTTGDDETGTEPVTTFATPTDPSRRTPPATEPAVTTEPSTTADPEQPGTPGRSPTSTATSTTTSAPPTLASLLGERGSVIPDQIAPRVRPTRLVIDDLYVDVPARPVGLEDDGQLEIPDETEVGWYRYGSVPGREGATVLAGHVTWNRTTGPFWLLRDLEPGSRIDVELDDGTVRSYEAVERSVYGKDELPRDRIWRNTGDETLVLITCGGDYNPDIRRYLENVVVYAVPIEPPAPTEPQPDAG